MACRLHHLSAEKAGGVREYSPVQQFRPQQARWLRHLSGARLTANQAVQLRLRSTARAAPYHPYSAAGHRSESSVKVQVRRTFRHKVAARDWKISDSALRRHQQARVRTNIADLSIVSPPVRLRAKQAVREKEGRALMVSPVGRNHQEAERPLPAGQREAEHPYREPSTANSSHNMERNPRKERHRRGRTNSLCWKGVCCRASVSDANP